MTPEQKRNTCLSYNVKCLSDMDISDLWMLSCIGYGEVLKHVDIEKQIRECLEKEDLIPKSSNDKTDIKSGITQCVEPGSQKVRKEETYMATGNGFNAEENAGNSSTDGRKRKLSGKDQTVSSEVSHHVPCFSKEEEDIDKVIQALVAAHDDCSNMTPRNGNPREKYRAEQAEYRRIWDENKHLQRDKKVVIDRVIESNIGFFETRTVETVKFAKRIPGFSSLDIADKVALIKESRQRCYVPSALRSCNFEEKVITLIPGKHITVEDMSHGFSDEFLQSIMKYSSLNSGTNLTAEEETIVDAIFLTVSGTCKDVLDKKAVEEIHRTLWRYLEYVVKKRGVPVGPRLSQIRSFISEINEMTFTLLDYLKNILINSPGQSTNRTLIEAL